MATTTIEIALYVDSDGGTRAVIDGNESHDDLNVDLACRMVRLVVEIPEQKAQKIAIAVPEDADAPATVTVK